jgi:hypothetical protein
MGFELKRGKDFSVLSEGTHPAILAAFVDQGEKEGPYGVQDQVIAIWITDEVDEENGEPLLGLQFLSKSTHPESNMGKVIKAVTGQVPKEDFSFDDLMLLLGKQATISTEHVTKDGKTKSKIILVSKANPKADKVVVPEDWTVPEGLSKGAVEGGVYTQESVGSVI